MPEGLSHYKRQSKIDLTRFLREAGLTTGMIAAGLAGMHQQGFKRK